jgi:hypothetical protein
MARYNTVVSSTSTTTTASLLTPNAGLFTKFTGTAPYTVTIGDPVPYAGQQQVFYNGTSGDVTVTFTPVSGGTFIGPASSGTTSQVIPTLTSLTIYSDGTNWVTAFDGGGPLVATTATFNNTVSLTGTTQTFAINSNKFTVAHATGNTLVAGTLTVTNAVILNSTDSVTVPVGTTAQRNGSPVTGMMRYNSDRKYVEVYNAQGWQSVGVNSWNYVDFANAGGNAVAGDFCWVSTSSTAVTIALPASPLKGDTIRFVDVARTFNARNLTISRNGQPIQGDAADLTVNTNGAAFDLIFYNATYGWRIFSI